MPWSYFKDKSEIAERPTCPRCATQMWLENVLAERTTREIRTFQCPVCERFETVTLDYR
jgi:hypothetical protein